MADELGELLDQTAGSHGLVEQGGRFRALLGLEGGAVDSGQDHDLGARGRQRDLGQRLDAGHARHQDVEQDEVGLVLAGHGDRFRTRSRFAHDLEAALELERQPHHGPQLGAVVGEDDPDG